MKICWELEDGVWKMGIENYFDKMSGLEKNMKQYSKAIVRLLKSPVERNSNVWNDVINYQNEIQEYIGQIGLELIVKKEEGFAFVKQFEDSEGNTLGLVVRR